MLLCCSQDEQVEGGELDLDGIDDQEIEKVTGLLSFLCPPAFTVKGRVLSLTLNVSCYSTS